VERSGTLGISYQLRPASEGAAEGPLDKRAAPVIVPFFRSFSCAVQKDLRYRGTCPPKTDEMFFSSKRVLV
jgi:hypothetical protein